MAQSIEEIITDLRSYVRGRGRDDNFLFDKVYSSSSGIFSVDFSPWIGKCLLNQDTLSLAVFRTLYEEDIPFSVEVSLKVSNDGDIEISDEKLEKAKKRNKSFKRKVNRCEKYNQYILDFPFDTYFSSAPGYAKIDLLTAWLLGYNEKKLPKIMMAYSLELSNAGIYLKNYNDRKKKQFQPPTPLANGLKFQEFQRELRRLPLATRLHLFDVYEYSTYGGKQMQKHLSEKTLYDTRAAGIDVNESAELLHQSKLITSFPDGGGTVSSEYIESVSIALDHAKKLEPVYYEWKSEIAELISNKTSVYFYDDNDPSKDRYYDIDEDIEI